MTPIDRRGRARALPTRCRAFRATPKARFFASRGRRRPSRWRLRLHERGLFTWPEWAATLADEIKRAQAAGDPDTGETYYRHWLNALERIVAEKGVTDAQHARALPRCLGSRRRPHAARRADRAAGRKTSRLGVQLVAS